MEEKAKNPVLELMARMGKWFWAFVGVAVLLVAAIVTIIVLAVSGNGTPDAITPPSYDEGPESGVYYYDAALGEYTLSLNSGNKFFISGPDLNKSGEYTVDGENITLDFLRDEDGTATATIKDREITLTLDDKTYNFLEKVYYTVTYNTVGGSAIESASVINGKLASKPDDPTLAGNVFLGWYADEALTTPYHFTTAVVKKNVTVYAKWAPEVQGEENFDVTLNMGLGGNAPEGVITVGGKLAFTADYAEPTLEGYTFGGWYVSMYEDGEKLTYKATEGTAITANTTLFAVWNEAGAKLDAPAVSINGNSVSWDAVLQGLKDINYKGTFNFETPGVFTSNRAVDFVYNGEVVDRLKKPSFEVWKASTQLLHAIGKSMLEEYDMFEE